MRLGCLLLPLLLLGDTKAPQAASDVRQWLPMTVGDCWVYEREILSGDRRHPHVDKWREADTIVAIHKVAEGLLIKRKVAFIKGAVPPQFVHNPSESNILVRDSCLYYIHELNKSFREALSAHHALPDVCFPLNSGAAWGDAHAGRGVWTVRGQGKGGTGDPASVTPDSWRLETSLKAGQSDFVWYQKNVGIVAKRTYRHGSFHEYRVRLVSFQGERRGSQN